MDEETQDGRQGHDGSNPEFLCGHRLSLHHGIADASSLRGASAALSLYSPVRSPSEKNTPFGKNLNRQADVHRDVTLNDHSFWAFFGGSGSEKRV
jgi:hypothetical protein